MAKLEGKIKLRLLSALEDLRNPKRGVCRPAKGDNRDPILADIFIAQEAKAWADKRLKKAWAAAQAEGVVPDDRDLREFGKGEHIVCDSSQFSCIVAVQSPRDNFNKELFIEAVSEKFKINASKLKGLADCCVSKSAAPLSKKILEASL